MLYIDPHSPADYLSAGKVALTCSQCFVVSSMDVIPGPESAAGRAGGKSMS